MEKITSAHVSENIGPYIGDELANVLENGVYLTHLYISQENIHDHNGNWRIPKIHKQIRALQKLVIDCVDYKKTNIILQTLRDVQLHCLHINLDDRNHAQYERQFKLFFVPIIKQMTPHTIHFSGVKQNDIPFVMDIICEYTSHRLKEVGFLNTKCHIDISQFKLTGFKIYTDNLSAIKWDPQFDGIVCVETKTWDVTYDTFFNSYTNVTQLICVCKFDDKEKYILKYHRHEKVLIMTKHLYEKHENIYNNHKSKHPDLKLVLVAKRSDYAIYL